MEKYQLIKEFGMHLKKARKSAELTQEMLADKVGLSRISITNIEAGRQHVTLYLLFLLARALGIKPSDLLQDIDHVEGIGESAARLFEKANLDNDVKSWAGKGLASIEKGGERQ